MGDNRYPEEVFNSEDYDDGTIVENVAALAKEVVGHRIVKAERRTVGGNHSYGLNNVDGALVITLDDGREVQLHETSDCCAYTELQAFLLHPELVDHMVLGVGTTEQYTKWHIYADLGDIMELTVGWSCGNPFYYGYGFAIHVEPVKGV